MHILLTGGTGYIGSHIAVLLVAAGYNVVIADNYSNSRPDTVEQINRILADASCKNKVRAFNINVCDEAALNELFASHEIEAVVHLAGFKSISDSVSKPLEYYKNNIGSAIAVLKVMRHHNVNRFVFSSSASVYGTPESLPLTEESPVGSCTNPYARTKYFIEQILLDASMANEAVSVVILRYFNPIGAHESGLIGELPNDIPNNLMPYITQTAAGLRHELKVFGNDYPTPDGTGIRDYIHVMDLAEGHLAALNYAQENKGAAVFNLGTGSGHSVLEVIDTFQKVNGLTVPFSISARRPGDIAECWADVSKAEKVLGWKAKRNLEEMCRDAWRWQQNCKI